MKMIISSAHRGAAPEEVRYWSPLVRQRTVTHGAVAIVRRKRQSLEQTSLKVTPQSID